MIMKMSIQKTHLLLKNLQILIAELNSGIKIMWEANISKIMRGIEVEKKADQRNLLGGREQSKRKERQKVVRNSKTPKFQLSNLMNGNETREIIWIKYTRKLIYIKINDQRKFYIFDHYETIIKILRYNSPTLFHLRYL